jgi:hypothetical protein
MRTLAALVVVAAGCGPKAPPPPPSAPPTAATPSATAVPSARAFVIAREADLLPGSESDGRVGDLRLDNGRCAFIVDRAESALGFADSGGDVIDAAPLVPGGSDSLKQVFGYLDDTFPRQPLFDRVEVVDAGGPGRDAVVRSTGRDSMDARLKVTTEYRLTARSCALRLTTIVENTGSEVVREYEIGDAVQWGRVERFVPGLGGAIHGRKKVAAGALLGLGEGATYAYVAPPTAVGDRQPTNGVSALDGRHGSAWSDLDVVTADIAPGQRAEAVRWLVVGPVDGAEVLAEIGRLRGEQRGLLEGAVVGADGVPALPGARVTVEDAAGKPVAVVRATERGYRAPLPPGRYRVRASGLGRVAPPVEVELPEGGGRRDLTLSPAGRLRFAIVDRDGGAPLPGKLTLLGVDGSAGDPELGPPFDAVGGNVALTASGRGELALAPGSYRVVASRGPEYSIDEKTVVVPGDGSAAEASFAIGRAVEMGDLLCADLHQHATPSPDSGVTLRDRAVANLAEGLEVLVATDHNVIVDWRPTLAALGAARPLEVVLGNEATLDGVGHFNAYPLALRPEAPRGGALDVRGLTAGAIVGALRAADGASDKVVQVNHPRAGLIGYFSMVKLDASAPSLPSGWAGDFDAIEVWSSKDLSQVAAPMADWLALLRRGLRYTAVGGSDAHLVVGQEVGQPRTCVARRPGATAAEALVEGIRRTRDVLVTNGPIVRVSVEGQGMGRTVAVRGGKARLAIEVQAAPWVDVRALEVLVGGVKARAIEVAPSTARVRYAGQVELAVKGETFVVVVARGAKSMEPVVARRRGHPPPLPMAITNPIWLRPAR